MTWVRHGYDTGTAPKIIVKIPNHRIRAREREREREAMKGEMMPIHTVAMWVRRQPSKVRCFLRWFWELQCLCSRMHMREEKEEEEEEEEEEISICSHLFVKRVFWSLNSVPPKRKPCARHVLLIYV